MKITYSPSADALAIRIVSGAPGVRTRELGPGIYADFDESGRLVGLEVLEASRHYPRKELEQLASPVEYLTLVEAAKESKLAAGTLKVQIHNERIPAIKRGRDWLIARHDLWNYLETRAPQGRPPERRGARKVRRDLSKASSKRASADSMGGTDTMTGVKRAPAAFQVQYFLVAESVEDRPDGKTDLREVLDRLTFPSLPAEFQFEIAVLLIAATEDGLADHIFGCQLVHPNGDVQDWGGEIGVIKLQPSPFGIATQRIIATLRDVTIREPGLHRLAFVVDGERVADAPLVVHLDQAKVGP